MSQDAGKLVLRLTLGLLMLMHGLAKVANGIGGIEGMLQKVGLPPTLAFGVYIGEVLAPLLVIVGFYTRLGAVLMAVNMLFAIGLAHAHQLFTLSKTGGWALELQGFFLLTSIALALLGPGRYGVNRH